MLEQLRRNSRSWLIWFIFAILIAAFVLFFGPQSGPEMFGCAGSQTMVAEVNGKEIQAPSWRFAMNVLGGTGGGSAQAAQRRAVAIDQLVEREILAAEAERLGMKVSDDLVRENIKIGEIYLLGQRADGRRFYFPDGVFDYKYLELWVKNSGLASVDAFIAEQKREILANLARDTLIASARTSLEEARTAYVDNNTRITLDYVLFPIARYATALELSEEAAKAYADGHADAIKTAWDNEKAQFATDKERALVRMIIINKAAAVPPTDVDTDTLPDDAKARAEAALARVVKGDDFATVASELSDDGRTKRRGGLIGWRSADALGYGTAVVDAVKKLEPGKATELVEGPRAFYIAKLEDKSSVALTFEQRAADIAYRLAATYYAEKLAARDANAALAKADGKALADVFERKQAAPQFPMPGGPGGQQFTPEQIKMIEEQLKKNMQDAPAPAPAAPGGDGAGGTETDGADGKQGAIWRAGDIRLAQAGGAPAEPAAGPSAKPADDGEVLPAADVPEPMVEKLGPLSRPGERLAFGRSKELVRDLFESLKEAEVAGKVYSLTEPDGLVIVQLLSRTEADLEKFADEADETREQMALGRGVATVHGFIERRCRELAADGEIGVNNAYLKYDDDKPALPYTACASLDPQNVLAALATRYPALAPFAR